MNDVGPAGAGPMPGEILAGGGRTGALVRAHDWSASPLGPPAAWPPALRTVAGVILAASQPMFVAWGPARAMLYNDLYAEILADKHPAALGRPFAEVWHEILDEVGPLMDRGFAGEPTTMDDLRLVMRRRGFAEETSFSFSYTPVRDEAGRVAGVLCACIETTARVLAERHLRASEAEAQDVLEGMGEGFLLVDRDFRIRRINAEGLRIDGRSRQEIVGRPLQEVWPEAEHMPTWPLYRQVMAERVPAELTYRHLSGRRDVWLEVRAYPSQDGLAVFYRDVTERRRAEQRLTISEESLRLATEAAEIGTWDLDLTTNVLTWSDRTKAMFGISPDAACSMDDFYAGLHPDDRDATSLAFASAVDPARRAVYDVEYRTVGKEDGVVRWVAAKGKGLFDETGRCVRALGTAIDVTARRAAETRLAETVATLDALLANAPIGFAFFDRKHRYVRINALLAGINGLPADAHFGRSIEELLPRNAESVVPLVERVFATGRAVEGVEVDGEMPARPGVARSWLASFFPVFGHGGAVAYVGATVIDITDRRRAEARVRHLNETLEAQVAERTAERDRVWRLSRDLLVVIGADGVFRAVNPAWTTILGHDPAEVVGRSFLEFVWPQDWDLSRDGLDRAASRHDLTSFENRYRHKDGSPRWISWNTSLEGGVVYAYGRDVTAEKAAQAELARAQDALRQAQKMEAVGQLTGGIAHDFNNMLAVVIGSLDLLGRRLGDGDARVRRYIEAATDGARRAALLTQRLLAFSRQQPLRPEAVDVNRLVAGMSDLLRHSLGGGVRLETVLSGEAWRTHADPNQLENVILNLAVNARDAMPDGGKLTIETRNVGPDPSSFGAEPDAPAGPFVEIAVTDTGSGMTPDVLARAFEPFFTTKEIGKGTGLGLSQVYGFVRQSGGHVRIESEPGRGTTVRLRLPRFAAAEAGAGADRAASEASGQARREMVLVVEDDPAVRQVAVEALGELGYRVLAAEDAAGALRLLDRTPEIALLFTDVVMPDVSGRKLADEARLRRPDLKVLFTTGGTGQTVAPDGALDPGGSLIAKPFTLQELAAKMREALDAAGPGAGE